MSAVTWKRLVGDTSYFAIELTLITEGGEDDGYDADERASAGSIAMWVDGVNVFENTARGTRLDASHWYLLPIAEWLVENWSPLLHEERLPGLNQSTNAAEGAAKAAIAAETAALARDSYEEAEFWQRWYARHNIRSSAEGALLPDLFLRRDGDYVEFSVGDEQLPGVGLGLRFSPIRPVRLPVENVASTLRVALEDLTQELSRRVGDSVRLRALRDLVLSLQTAPENSSSRLAWLSGAGEDVEGFIQLWREVEESLPPELVDRAKEFAQSSRSTSEPSVVLAAPATMLFGSLSPTVDAEDVKVLYGAILRSPHAPSAIASIESVFNTIEVEAKGFARTAGEQGTEYGEGLWANYSARMLGSDGIVDIESFILDIGVTIATCALNDDSLRAVSVVTNDGRIQILVNENFKGGATESARRFTLAHELAHLILDRGRAADLVVASGAWAPVEIERRANAFAAAALMPIPLLSQARGELSADVKSADSLGEMADKLGVGFLSLVARLQNLGVLSYDDAAYLRYRR